MWTSCESGVPGIKMKTSISDSSLNFMVSKAGPISPPSCRCGMVSSAASAGATTFVLRCTHPPLSLMHENACYFLTCASCLQLNKGDWTTDEDVEIWERVQQMGTKWAQISKLYMPSRTDNDIKNRWNSIIRKQHHPGGP